MTLGNLSSLHGDKKKKFQNHIPSVIGLYNPAVNDVLTHSACILREKSLGILPSPDTGFRLLRNPSAHATHEFYLYEKN